MISFLFILPPLLCLSGSQKKRARHAPSVTQWPAHDPDTVGLCLGISGQLLGVQVLAYLTISLGKFQNILAVSAQQAWQFRNTAFPACSDIHRLTDNLQQTSKGLMSMLVRESGCQTVVDLPDRPGHICHTPWLSCPRTKERPSPHGWLSFLPQTRQSKMSNICTEDT